MINNITGLVEIRNSAESILATLQQSIAVPSIAMPMDGMIAEAHNIIVICSGLLERRDTNPPRSISELLSEIKFEPETVEV